MTLGIALTIIGIVGNVTAICLFLSPIPTFRKIYKGKSTKDFSCIPYIATLFNCLLWLFYGSRWVSDGLLIETINGCGTLIQAFYLLIFLVLAKDKQTRVVTILYISTIVVLFGVIVLVNMLAISTKSSRKTIVGILCVIVGSLMYSSPLTIMRIVIKTKSTQYMPFLLSLFNLLNGTVWTTYGGVAKDIFILIPNGLGVLFGLCQLILYGCYCGNTWIENPTLVAFENPAVVVIPDDSPPDSVIDVSLQVNVYNEGISVIDVSVQVDTDNEGLAV